MSGLWNDGEFSTSQIDDSKPRFWPASHPAHYSLLFVIQNVETLERPDSILYNCHEDAAVAIFNDP